MSCHQNGEFLVDTCGGFQTSSVFSVDVGEMVYLSACGLEDGVVLPVLHSVGTTGCWTPLGGTVLAQASPQAVVTMPGTYMVDLTAVPEGVCVKVSAKEYPLCASAIPVQAQAAAATQDKVRYVTHAIKCEYVSPYPECIDYTKVTQYYNCPPLTTEHWFRGATSIPTPSEETLMSLKSIASPSIEPTVEKYASRFVAVDSTSGVTDVASLVAFVAANDSGDGEYPTFGAVDPAADMVMTIMLAPRPEDGADMLLVDGFEQGGFSFTSGDNGGYDDAAGITLVIPNPCNFLASVCWTKSLTKAEVAAL